MLSESDVALLCCVACRGSLALQESGLSCRTYGAHFPTIHGFPDFRGFADSPSEMALNQEISRCYPTSSYTELIAFHYRWIREKDDPQGSAGRAAQWDLEQAHYVDSIDTFGKWHLEGALAERAKLEDGVPARQAALDVGCGWGRDLIAIAQARGAVWGIDVEPRGE